MDIPFIQSLVRYHFQRLDEVWASILNLEEYTFNRPIPYSLGSIRAQMTHLIDDEAGWISLIDRQPPPRPVDPESNRPRDEIYEAYLTQQARTRSVVASLATENRLDRFEWHPPFRDQPLSVTTRQVIVHVVNHGTDHRGQVLRIIHDFGGETFDQDLMGHWIATEEVKKS